MRNFVPIPLFLHDDGPLPRHHRAHCFGWHRSQLRAAKFGPKSTPSKPQTPPFYGCMDSVCESRSLHIHRFCGVLIQQ